MDDKQAARERLEAAADVLEQFTTPLDVSARAIAAGIRRYLAGEHDTLDAALGLVAGRGRPSKEAEHLVIARKIFTHYSGRQNGRDVIDWPAAFKDIPMDERELRRIWKRNKLAVLWGAALDQRIRKAGIEQAYRDARENMIRGEQAKAGQAGDRRRAAILTARLQNMRPTFPALSLLERSALRPRAKFARIIPIPLP